MEKEEGKKEEGNGMRANPRRGEEEGEMKLTQARIEEVRGGGKRKVGKESKA